MMIYRLRKSQMIGLFLMPSVVTLGWVIALLWQVPATVSIIGFVLSGFVWYSEMTSPFEFEIGDSDSLRFRAVARRQNIPISDFREVDARLWNRGFVTLRYSAGRIYLLRTMPGMKDLIEHLQKHNSKIVVRGGL
jgi:hypothetical protein